MQGLVALRLKSSIVTFRFFLATETEFHNDSINDNDENSESESERDSAIRKETEMDNDPSPFELLYKELESNFEELGSATVHGMKTEAFSMQNMF